MLCADALAAQRLVDEIRWFAPSLAVALLPGLGDAAVRPFLAAPGPGLRAPRDAVPDVAQRDCDVVVTAAQTALHRLPPPSFLAAHTFFLKQGQRLDVEQPARAARARRLRARDAGRVAGRVLGARRTDRPVPDGRGAAVPPRPVRRRARRRSRPSTSTRSARCIRCPRSGCCRRASSRSTTTAARASARASAKRFEGDPSRSALYKDVSQRRRARRHRVLPAAVLRRDRDVRRLPAARRGRRAARRRARGRPRASGRTPRRATGCCAATRRARCCRRATCSCRRTSSSARLKSFARVELPRPRSAVDAGDERAATRPLPSVAVDRRADDPLAALKALRRDARRARAGVRRERGPARDDAPVLRRVRPAAAARRRLRVVPSQATHASRSSAAPLHAGFAWRDTRIAFVTEAELYAGVVRRARARRRPPLERRRDGARPVRGARRRPGRARAARHRPLPRPHAPRPRRRADRVPAARLRQRREALRAGVEPAPDLALQRRVARTPRRCTSSAAASGRRRSAARRRRRTTPRPSC